MFPSIIAEIIPIALIQYKAEYRTQKLALAHLVNPNEPMNQENLKEPPTIYSCE